MMAEKQTKKIKKFHLSKISLILLGVILVICSGVYVLCLFIDKQAVINTLAAANKNGAEAVPNSYYIISILKDVLLVVMSITGTTILSTVLIEVKSQNSIYADLLVNDIFSSPEFYNTLSDKNRQSVLENLQKNLYFGGDKKKTEMYDSIRSKMGSRNVDKYYYESCEYIVSCSVLKDRIEKTIVRTTKIRSYQDSCVLNDLILTSSTSKVIGNLKQLEMTKATINGAVIDPNDIHTETETVNKQLHMKCGYDVTARCCYKKEITIFNDMDTEISVTYKSNVPIGDITYACRVRYPCKRFSLHFKLENSPKYKVSAYAFGFCDDATQTPNDDCDNDIHISFNDWIFNSDGVAVVINRKN